MKLSGKTNLAHEIVDVVTEDLRREEVVQVAKIMLDLALNDDCLHPIDRSTICMKICLEFGLNPPKSIKDWLM